MIPVANLLQVIVLLVHGDSPGHVPQHRQPRGAEGEAGRPPAPARPATGHHPRRLLQKPPPQVPELSLGNGEPGETRRSACRERRRRRPVPPEVRGAEGKGGERGGTGRSGAREGGRAGGGAGSGRGPPGAACDARAQRAGGRAGGLSGTLSSPPRLPRLSFVRCCCRSLLKSELQELGPHSPTVSAAVPHCCSKAAVLQSKVALAGSLRLPARPAPPSPPRLCCAEPGGRTGSRG